MNFYLFTFCFLVLSLFGMIVGVYTVYSGIKRGKGVVLPKKNYIPIFFNPKEGQEWVLVIVGIGWTLGMLLLFGAGIAALVEHLSLTT